MISKGCILIAALVVALLLPAPLPRAAAQGEPPTQTAMRGVFYNQRTKTGGPAIVTLQADGDAIQGTMNITGFPGASQTHCGAGTFTASRAITPLTFSFTSQDEDTGCGYDWGSEYTVTASLDHEATHLWGDISIKPADRSAIKSDTAFFEVWAPEGTSPSQTYAGTFRNETLGLDGMVSLSLIEGTQLISGSIDFDNLPGEQTLCGGGPFVGTVDQPLVFTAAGRDPDPGCGFAFTFAITATPPPDRTSITGTFQVGSQRGTFTAKRVSAVTGSQATIEPTVATAPTTIAAAPAAPRTNPSSTQRSSAPPGLSTFLGLLVMVLVAGALLTFVIRLVAPSKRAPKPAQTSQALPRTQYPAASSSRPGVRGVLPYARIPQLLTPAEHAFYEVLMQATPPHLTVFAQVRLANLVKTTTRNPKQQKYDFYRIQAKCVDFVLCDAVDTAPRLVVELDDSSHQLQHRQERDAFVDAVLASVSLPILHVRWQPQYDPAHLAEQIRLALGESLTPAPPVATVQQTSTGAPAYGVAPQTTAVPNGPAAASQPPSVAAVSRELRYACGQCHREVRPDAKYCPHCSAMLGKPL